MMNIQIKDWKKFQHYKDRRPPWIKLYRELLDDMEFFTLSGDGVKLLIMLWLVASEDPDLKGKLPAIKELSFRLRMTEEKLQGGISELSHWLTVDASGRIAPCGQPAIPETERETERETDAPVHLQEQYEHVGERETLTQQVVAVVMAAFKNWPQDQAEPSVMKLGVRGAGISLEGWKQIANDAYKNLEPEAPIFKYHKELSHQMAFYLRNIKGRQEEKKKEKEPYWLPAWMFRPSDARTQGEALEYSKSNDPPAEYQRNVEVIKEHNAIKNEGSK